MTQNHSSTQVLARKWRPRELSALVGQEHVVRALRHALQTQRLHHAYLFTGTRGVGKTTLARILAKALNCETGITDTPCGVCTACRDIDQGRFVDLLEVDAATNTGVDEMRDLLEKAMYAPTSGRYKVYVIDEVHMLSKAAFNAMLKTLEEPPPHILFVLATTDPQKIPVTVLSRCLQFNLKQMPPAHVVEHLEKVLTAEGIEYERGALQLIGRAAQGSMRDALSLTDQAIAYSAGKLSQADVATMLGAIDQRYLLDLLQALAMHDGSQLLAVADDMAARSLPLGVALQNLAALLYRLSVAHVVPSAIADDDPERDTLMALREQFSPTQLQLYYQIATHGRRELLYAPDEASGFGMCLLRMLAFVPDGSSPAPQGPVPARPGAQSSSAPAAARSATPTSNSGSGLAGSSGGSGGAVASASALRVATTQPEPEPELQHGTPARNAIEALGNVLAGMSRGNAALAAEPANAVAPPVYHEPVRQRPAPPRIEPGFDGGPTPDFGFEPDFGLQPDSGSVSDFDPGDADLPASNGAPRLSLVKSALATAPADAASDLAAEVPTAEAPTAEVPAAEVPAAVDDAARSPIQIGAIPDQAGWPAFVTRLPASGLLRQMLERTQLESFVSDQGRHAVLLSVGVKAYLDPVHAQRASQLLSDVFQSGVTVKVQLGAATLTAAALAEQQNRERMAQADAAVRQDPFVQVLQTRLGAQIVPGSIRPLSRSGELS